MTLYCKQRTRKHRIKLSAILERLSRTMPIQKIVIKTKLSGLNNLNFFTLSNVKVAGMARCEVPLRIVQSTLTFHHVNAIVVTLIPLLASTIRENLQMKRIPSAILLIPATPTLGVQIGSFHSLIDLILKVGYLVTEYNSSPVLAYDFAIGGATAGNVKVQIERQFIPHAAKNPDWAPWTRENSLFCKLFHISD